MIKKLAWVLFPLIILSILACFTDANGQVIAADELPYFMGRIGILDGWGDTLDFSHFLEWRLDSLAYADNWDPVKSPDGGGCWAVASGNVEPSTLDPLFGFWKYKFQLMTVLWDMALIPGRLLTVWQIVGTDSVRFLCIDSVVSVSGIDQIKRVQFFPDSSILLHCQLYDWCHGIVEGSDRFFRAAAPCEFQQIYAACWRNFSPIKTYVSSDRLLMDRYRISEITEYLTVPERMSTVLAGPNSMYDGSLLDSAKVRVIDLWDLAKEEFGIDTTPLLLDNASGRKK
jgi:hypothetical protein